MQWLHESNSGTGPHDLGSANRGTPIDVVVSFMFGPATTSDLPGSMLILIDHMDGDA